MHTAVEPGPGVAGRGWAGLGWAGAGRGDLGAITGGGEGIYNLK